MAGSCQKLDGRFTLDGESVGTGVQIISIRVVQFYKDKLHQRIYENLRSRQRWKTKS